MELVLLPAPDAGLLYGVTDPGDLAWMAERLTGHPWQCFTQPLELTNEEALWAIPQFHIVCTSTLATRDAAQMATARAEGRLWDIDTGHDLMITEPEKTALPARFVQAAADLAVTLTLSGRVCQVELGILGHGSGGSCGEEGTAPWAKKRADD